MQRFLVVLILTVTLVGQTSTPATPGSQPSSQTGQSAPEAQDNAVKAKALLDQAIQALGGDAYLKVADMSQQGRTYSFHRGDATSAGVLFWRLVKFPERERIELTKQRDVVYVYNGIRGYEVTFKGTTSLDSKLLGDYLRRRDHSLEIVLRQWMKEPGVALFYEGSAIAADKPADQVSILTAKNDSVTLYLDSTTHLPIKKSYSWRDPSDNLPNKEEEIYDAYRPTQGIMTPYSLTRFYNGEMSNQRFVNTVTYNNNLNDSLFEAKTTYDPETLPQNKK
jgi:hypothetical protein